MESEYNSSCAQETYRKLFFSIYCDETLLAKSGSQDAAIIRVRADNVKQKNTEWFDVGIPPKIKVGTGPISDAKKRAAKLDLLHRFMFLILEDISLPNLSLTVRKFGFEPCLLGFVVDQPQEREFCCLKRGNCEQDCSVCCFKSAEDRKKRKRTREKQTNNDQSGSKPGRAHLALHQTLEDERYQGGNDILNKTRDESSITSSESSEERRAHMPAPVSIERYKNRDARRTVRIQLQAAVEKRRKSKESTFMLRGVNSMPPGQLKKAIYEELHKQGVLSFPPVFGCLKGICDGLGRLYTLPTIDLLHCFDLGPSKQFCDETYRVLERPLYGNHYSRSKLIKVINQRVADMSWDTDVRGLRPFKAVETDRQASYSGKQRRLLCPLLWSVISGLNRNPPDEEPLFIVALSLAEMQAELRGINRSTSSRMRTSNQIDHVQQRCRTACRRFIDCFQVNESTKLHRFIVHIGAHLRAFGNLRMSDAGRNESFQREVKDSYRATNKHLEEIRPQLLQVHISAEHARSPITSPAVSHLLLTRDPLSSGQQTRVLSNFGVTTQAQKDYLVAQEMDLFIQNERRRLGSRAYIPILIKRFCDAVDGFDRFKYKRKFKVTIEASFEWSEENEKFKVRQTLHAVRAKGVLRNDSVRYSSGNEVEYGRIEAIFERLPTVRDKNLEESIFFLSCENSKRSNRMLVMSEWYWNLVTRGFVTSVMMWMLNSFVCLYPK